MKTSAKNMFFFTNSRQHLLRYETCRTIMNENIGAVHAVLYAIAQNHFAKELRNLNIRYRRTLQLLTTSVHYTISCDVELSLYPSVLDLQRPSTITFRILVLILERASLWR